MKSKRPTTARRNRARKQRRQEGAVLLVVLLVVMVATTTAAVSVSSTQSEIRAVGQERVAMHSRYAAEAGMVSTLAWTSRLAEGNDLYNQYMDWSSKPAPELRRYGEREMLVANRHQSGRVLMQNMTFTAPPIGEISEDDGTTGTGGSGGTTGGTGGATGGTGGATGGSGGGGGTSGSVSAPAIDSFGPNQRYTAEPFTVDFTDCSEATDTSTAGQQVGGPQGLVPVQITCTVTSRSRLLFDGTTTRTWSFDGLNNFTLPTFSTAHGARAVVIFSPQLVSKNG